MKPNILLVAEGAHGSNALILEAAARTGHAVTHARTTGEAFEMLRNGTADTDLAIIDVDPGIHSLAVLEAISHCKNAPPVIVVTGFEESLMEPVAWRHGASACIGKPFGAGELACLIAELRPDTSRPQPETCDLWGHPRIRISKCRNRPCGCEHSPT